MSSEGRAKRGIAGQANAKAHPFRMNGRAPDWQARGMGCHHVAAAPSGGSTTMRGMVGGMLAQKLGFQMHGSRYEHMLSHAQSRCTHELFADDAPLLEAAE